MGRRRSRANKHRLEKRRRTRRYQRGGAESTSIGDWIEAVRNSPAFKKDDPKFIQNPSAEPSVRLGAYRLTELTTPATKLPNIDSTQANDSFDINRYAGNDEEPVDLRVEGANIRAKWAPFLSVDPPPTPADFKIYINQHMNTDLMKVDPDFRTAVNHLISVENKLRRGDDSVVSLSDETKYPLFVWALMMNPPDKTVAEAPSLFSKKDVSEELRSQGFSEDVPATPQVPAGPTV